MNATKLIIIGFVLFLLSCKGKHAHDEKNNAQLEVRKDMPIGQLEPRIDGDAGILDTRKAVTKKGVSESVVARKQQTETTPSSQQKNEREEKASTKVSLIKPSTGEKKSDRKPPQKSSSKLREKKTSYDAEAVPKTAESSRMADSVSTRDAPKPSGQKTINFHQHKLWDNLLQQTVDASGRVDYKLLKTMEAQLDQYLLQLDKNVPNAGWSRAEVMAYWINAYNAFTIKMILMHYPVRSIKALHGGKVWDLSWIQLGSKSYSLNQIEHDILRKQYQDPRIHFAVNCAALSCPPLWDRAWTADHLEATLESRTKAFINDLEYNELSTRPIRISKLFEWYAEDFGAVIDYLNRYADSRIESDATIQYLPYHWDLNEG